MRILMLAPEPVFSPRGTPFSVLNRCRALAALGHEVDLVTYPLGQDVDVPGLRFIRAMKVPGVSRIDIGPSKAKVALDASLFARTVLQLMKRRYDVVHTHEEAGMIGWWLHRIARTPHLYDMHSDLAQQLTNFSFGPQHPLTRFAGWLERRIIRSAASVIVICPDLVDRARKYAPRNDPVLIENVSFDPLPSPAAVERLRADVVPEGKLAIVYAGSFEPYQGVPLLLDAMAELSKRPAGQQAHLVIAGGQPHQLAAATEHARQAGVSDHVTFLGVRPSAEANVLVSAADVLVSPRISGTNTPLKIYSWLRTGRPIVATRLYTHTQVLDDTTSLLVEPTPAAFADGLERLLNDAALRERIGTAARELAAQRYTTRSYLERVIEAYERMGLPAGGLNSVGQAVATLEAA